MEFGFNFFPDVSPQVKSGQQYFREALNLVELGECYGYTHVRTVEHYFQAYGGYSPNPIVFLAAAAQRTHTMRLVTGAVLPVFNNPLKLAGELGMLDAISNGRLDIGVARAFLPLEYAAFGVSMDESRERFEEGFAHSVCCSALKTPVLTGSFIISAISPLCRGQCNNPIRLCG
jgi:alkanesulfonate monooxygenase SsuD/methylene tetrahydromethanopterin reductase-like flavin-dependent oxidoreductase (luciferase family)